MRAIAVAACGLSLASCSAISPHMPGSSGFETAPTTATVAIESYPPGAEATASFGGTCRTPCALTVPISPNAFTVTYALAGFSPQTIPVRIIPAERTAWIDMTPPKIEPDPVLAELKPAPPPPPEPPPTKKRPRS